MGLALNTPALKIAVAQLNPVVGDIAGNAALILEARAKVASADLIVGSELLLSGYPPEDLVLRPGFLDDIEQTVARIAAETKSGPAILLGTPWRQDGKTYNAMLLLEEGRIAHVTLKHHLPNYGVFDEKRVFAAGPLPQTVRFRGFNLGILICEDMWFPDVVAALVKVEAQLLIVPNGSPYEAGKIEQRLRHARARVAETGVPLLYVNQVGGQDELVFDGASFAIMADGEVKPVATDFGVALAVTEWTCEGQTLSLSDLPPVPAWKENEAQTYEALKLGLGDYVRKNGFRGVLLGLSGGIDSALSAAIAVDALGAENVKAIMLPSPYTSAESIEDAASCAALLGIALDTIPIMAGMDVVAGMVGDVAGITGENIQSRLRGLILMALSNRDGLMLLSTGNKSEMAVGYATLYGDMCGGFAVLKDVYKTEVYQLANWRNRIGRVIPERVITKAPSAELKPDQTDQDTLPPYDVLDSILAALVEGQAWPKDHQPATVDHIWKLLCRAEYKRRQSPPGVRITARCFGRERRYPITSRY